MNPATIPARTDSWSIPDRRVLHGRTAVVLDVENLLGEWGDEGRVPTAEAIGLFADLCDRLVVACGPRTAIIGVGDYRLLPALAVTALRHRIRLVPTSPGPDEADGVIVDRVFNGLPFTPDDLVLGSGDGGFAMAVKATEHLGVPVTVLSHTDRLSRLLAATASTVWRFSDPEVAKAA